MGAFFAKLKSQIVKNFKKKRYSAEYFPKNTLGIHYKDVNNHTCAIEHSTLNNVSFEYGITRAKVINDFIKFQSPCDNYEFNMSDAVPLSSMNKGDAGKISYILSKNDHIIKKLISMGFVPGRYLKLSAVVFKEGARIVEIGGVVIAIDKNTASTIYVSTM